jgi:predicted metal-dependent hydrolase
VAYLRIRVKINSSPTAVTIPYDIIRSKRIKTSEIIVDADKVTIRTPLNKDISGIRKLVLGKASWILKKTKTT